MVTLSLHSTNTHLLSCLSEYLLASELLRVHNYPESRTDVTTTTLERATVIQSWLDDRGFTTHRVTITREGR